MGFIFILTYMCFLAPVYQAKPQSVTISDLSSKNMDFALKLYEEISGYHDDNIFFSPLSISTSFAAFLMATDGETRQEILRGFKLEQLERADQPELIPLLFQLLHENITHNGSLKLDQNMALFVRQEFDIEKTFENQIKKFFYADIRNVNFNDTKESVRYINEYIRQKTEDKVRDMMSTLNAVTQLMLINTIFFQGKFCGH